MNQWFSKQYMLNQLEYNRQLKNDNSNIDKAVEETNKSLFIPDTVCFAQNIKYNDKITYRYKRVSLNDAYELLKIDSYLYEIIARNMPRCFYIDIDFKGLFDDESIKHHESKIIKFVESLVNYVVNKKLKLNITLKTIHVLTSSRHDRVSVHMLFKDINFENFDTMKAFSSHIEDTITIKPFSDNIYVNDIDTDVYTSNRLFRTINQTKLKYNAYPLICNNLKTSIKHLLIGYYKPSIYKSKLNFINVESIEAKVKIKKQKIKKKLQTWNCPVTVNDLHNYNNILDLYIDIIPNFGLYIQSITNWLKMGRCIKSIYNNNTGLKMWIKWSIQAIDKYSNNEHACKEKWNELILEDVSQLYFLTNNKDLIKKFTAIINNKKLTQYKVTEDIIKIDINQPHIEERFQLFTKDNANILVVKSKTGSGKTYMVLNTFQEFKKLNKLKSFIFVSTRIAAATSISSEFKKSFSTMKNYLELSREELINQMFLSIQYESIHKIGFKFTNQFLILDEIESILNLLDSMTNTGKNYDNTKANFESLMNLIKISEYIIILDANIGARTMKFVESIKQYKKVVFIENHFNTVKNNNSKAYYYGKAIGKQIKYYKQNHIDNIVKALLKNENVYCVVSSKKFAIYIYDYILKHSELNFTNKNIALYTSLTDDDSFKEDLSDVNKCWITKRLIITTSKITNGVDFNIEGYFHSAFMYINNNSCVARDDLQTLRRIRHLVNNEVHYMIAENFNNDDKNTSLFTTSCLTSITNPLFYNMVSLNRQERANTQKNIEYEIRTILDESGYKHIDVPFVKNENSIACNDEIELPIDYQEYENLRNILLNNDNENIIGTTTQQKIYIEMKSLMRKLYIFTDNRQFPSYELLKDTYTEYNLKKIFEILYMEKQMYGETELEENINSNEQNIRFNIVKKIYDIIGIKSFCNKDILQYNKNSKNKFIIQQDKIDELNSMFQNNMKDIINVFNVKSKQPITIFKKIISVYCNNILDTNTNIIKKSGNIRLNSLSFYSKASTVDFTINYLNNLYYKTQYMFIENNAY